MVPGVPTSYDSTVYGSAALLAAVLRIEWCCSILFHGNSYDVLSTAIWFACEGKTCGLSLVSGGAARRSPEKGDGSEAGTRRTGFRW